MSPTLRNVPCKEIWALWIHKAAIVVASLVKWFIIQIWIVRDNACFVTKEFKDAKCTKLLFQQSVRIASKYWCLKTSFEWHRKGCECCKTIARDSYVCSSGRRTKGWNACLLACKHVGSRSYPPLWASLQIFYCHTMNFQWHRTNFKWHKIITQDSYVGTLFMVFSDTYTICKGPKADA